MFSRIISAALLSTATLLAASSANAAIVSYNVDAAIGNNQGTVEGSFSVDTTSDTVTALNILTTPVFGVPTQFTTTGMPTQFSLSDVQNTYGLNSFGVPTLSATTSNDAGGEGFDLSFPVDGGTAFGSYVLSQSPISDNIFGTVTLASPGPSPVSAVPLPASISMLLTAFAALAGLSLTKSRNTAL